MADDFTVTAHALERFEERFPDIYHRSDCSVLAPRANGDEEEEVICDCRPVEENDRRAAKLIHEESEAALDQGRASAVAPLELANYDLSRWTINKNKGLVVWTPDKTRGYVVIETDDGQLVTTVLKGKDVSSARKMLYRDERPSRVKGEE